MKIYLLPVALLTGWLLAGMVVAQEGSTASPQLVLRNCRAELAKRFDGLLCDPQGLQRRIDDECRMFPEGNLLPCVYVGLGYVNQAQAGKLKDTEAVARLEKLIPLAMASVIKQVKPPNDRLTALADYRQQAVYLGEFNLLLGGYRLVGGKQFSAEVKHISDLLHAALEAREGKPLHSYPQQSWPFDTIPVLISLQLYDHRTGDPRSQAASRQHLEWVRKHATNAAYGLPDSRIDLDTGKMKDPPRGGDLALRICLLRQLDPDYAAQLYAGFVKHYWRDRGGLAGFAEWPDGGEQREDIDSGPIINGLGLAASGIGIGTTIAMRDTERLLRLCQQLERLHNIRGLTGNAKSEFQFGSWRGVNFNTTYTTGFLMGDAMLFYAVTWTDWGLVKRP